ncbi:MULTISPECIES: DegT/DnrJ/EryC1/StrS family aminotransferase [Methylosinus]|uniref:DegT/DnrJ/EryC1/StrS family aminotransferase n=1 Tax=Methylosinus trichosporium (strain ATCC 35070 / NCIMB 11131 / UNIQEM 75 / OB3b) TaxID=595536 RepID=A0A2D2CZ15_METT3|nr:MULTISPECIES: DegT/DnrJ/EryC1/StrS family aminotransferase [Methylosinus]ATQ67970.1 DegT/DnrJ/EryC1/StrS family aminotransferase [Methylosinus trichosporium OB3b]OBS53749.1 aminotransferase DegT [Methylosinus sp. 3S-1]
MQTSTLPLNDPDLVQSDLDLVIETLTSPRLSAGPVVEQFEAEFAKYLGRKHAIAVSSGTIGLMLILRAYGIGPGDEVVASAHSFRETTHAIALSGARPVFADIDYWAGTLEPDKAEKVVTERTKAIVAGNTNGHPAPWDAFRQLAETKKIALFEDSTEAIGSVYKGRLVGSFGDCAVFDFSQPSVLACGEGGMIVTDDDDKASIIRNLRSRRIQERSSVVLGAHPPMQAGMSDITAALGLAQFRRLELLLARRTRVERWYYEYVKSFEGIKDPYIGPDVEEVHWFLYVVHLGTRFSRSSRDAIIEDLHTEKIEAAAYSHPLHLQRYYFDLGYRRGNFFVTEKVADRAVALPFHAHLTENQIAFIVGTMKDASINIGAGAAIYL